MLEDLKFMRLHGRDIQAFIPDVARLRIEIFRDFPYLYEGDLAYEEKYLQAYMECPESILVLALDQDKVVGASTGMPLKDALEELQKPFQEKKLNVKDIFYFGESVLQHRYRSRGVYARYFHDREVYARTGKYGTAAFCAVERDVHHPRRPKDYINVEDFWKRIGYQKHSEIKTQLSWKEFDEKEESPKPMVFWLKNLWQ